MRINNGDINNIQKYPVSIPFNVIGGTAPYKLNINAEAMEKDGLTFNLLVKDKSEIDNLPEDNIATETKILIKSEAVEDYIIIDNILGGMNGIAKVNVNIVDSQGMPIIIFGLLRKKIKANTEPLFRPY